MFNATLRVLLKIKTKITPKNPTRHPTKVDAFNKLKSLGVPVGAIIDVGVLEGTEELIKCYPHLHHILCEPISEFHKKIDANYSTRVDSHEIIPYAIGDLDGEVYMVTETVSDDQSITHAKHQNEQDKASFSTSGRKVPIRSLDTIIKKQSVEKPFLLKIDIDGKDLDVIRGAEKTLLDCSIICLEVGLKNIHQRLSAVLKCGFQLFDLVDICYYDGRLIQMDAIFVRKTIIKDLGLEFYKDGFDISKWEAYL
jgi:FkbM family methyltransferase